MIDIGKYRGHGPPPWQVVFDDTDGHVYVVIAGFLGGEVQLHLPCWMCEEDMLELTATAQLIADAPLLLGEVKRLRKEINQLPIDLHESLDMILKAHYPEVRKGVMSMFGDAWGNNLTGYEE